ncbi:MAG: dioxygenase family protein [Elusimicrobiota bacterium]|jgi:aromatic ring-opening dioxygenase catalytic subunit (LigB family)
MTNSHRPGRLRGFVIPHSATLLEDDAHARHSPAVDSLKELHKELAREKIDAVLALSPFWLPEHSFCVDVSPRHRPAHDYHGYSVEIKYHCPGDPDLAHALLDAGRRAGLPVRQRRHGVDHSAGVAMHFLFPKGDTPLVPLSSSELPLEQSLAWGRAIRETVEASQKDVLLLCGGGLSHNLTACLHWEESIGAVIFDQKVLQCLEGGRGTEVSRMDPHWIEVGNPTAEFRDLFIFLGAVGPRAKGRVLAYEGAPGVGWAVVKFG